MPISKVVTNSIASGQTFALNGVQFPATAVPSADANTLDDYEEGTFTPTLGGASGNSYSYATQIGSYTKIGRVVYFNLHIKLNINTAGTGNLYFDGLPFTVGTWHAVNIWFSRVAFGSVVVSPLAWSSLTSVYLTTNTSNGDYNYLTASTVGTGTDKEFRCTGFYYVS